MYIYIQKQWDAICNWSYKNFSTLMVKCHLFFFKWFHLVNLVWCHCTASSLSGLCCNSVTFPIFFQTSTPLHVLSFMFFFPVVAMSLNGGPVHNNQGLNDDYILVHESTFLPDNSHISCFILLPAIPHICQCSLRTNNGTQRLCLLSALRNLAQGTTSFCTQSQCFFGCSSPSFVS